MRRILFVIFITIPIFTVQTTHAKNELVLNYKGIALMYIKHLKRFNFKAYALDLSKIYNSSKYTRFQSDEFRIQEVNEHTVKLVKNGLRNISKQDTFVLKTYFQFGKYDFGKQQFALSPFKKKKYFPLYHTIHRQKKFLPRLFRIYVTNPNIVNGLRMSPKGAKRLLGIMRNRSRLVPAFIEFRVRRFERVGPVGGYRRNHFVKVTARISKIKMYLEPPLTRRRVNYRNRNKFEVIKTYQ